MINKIFYLCDGEVPDCKKTACYKRGGSCRHTTSIEHAKNFRGREGSDKVWEEARGAMTINKIYDSLLAYMDASIAVNGQIEAKAREALKELRNLRWRPVAEGEFPENESIVLVSFENVPVPAVLTYREDPEGGAFYDDADPIARYGFISSAWRPLDRYEE